MILPTVFGDDFVINSNGNALRIFKTVLLKHTNNVGIFRYFFFFFIDKNNHVVND